MAEAEHWFPRKPTQCQYQRASAIASTCAWLGSSKRATGTSRGRRSVIVGYVQDGPNLVTLAMNGWADPEPA
jgi:hypothetical protein